MPKEKFFIANCEKILIELIKNYFTKFKVKIQNKVHDGEPAY